MPGVWTVMRAFHGVMLVSVLAAPASSASTLRDALDPAAMRVPIERVDGIGSCDMSLTTPSPGAKVFHDQGLALLHSYEWTDAARSFHQALREDELLAMAHASLARVALQTRDLESARAHLARATALAPRASEHEQRLIAAMQSQLDLAAAPPDARATLLAAYRAELDAILEANPNDPEAWILRGLAEEAGGLGRGQHGGESTLRYYETALQLRPYHPGAHHYLANSLENLGRYAQAQEHAERYAHFAQAMPHAHHVAGHTLPRMRRWQEAAKRFETADTIERARVAAGGAVQGEYGAHNLALLGLTYEELGRSDDAATALKRAFDAPNPSVTMRLWWSLYPEYLIVEGRADEAHAAAVELSERDSPMLDVIGIALAGEAALSAGRIGEARERSAAAQKALAALREGLAGDPFGASLLGFAAKETLLLRARIALRSGEMSDAEARTLAEKIASSPTFDGWARAHLGIRRLEQDARAAGRETLAGALAAQAEAFRGPGPAPTPSPPATAAGGVGSPTTP